jgi:gluconolactonase
MKLSLVASLTLTCGASLAACSSDPSVTPGAGGSGAGASAIAGGAGQAAGAPSTAGQAGAPMNVGGGGATSAGAAGAAAGSGGAATAGAGAGGSSGGGSGAGGSVGTAGAGGASFWGPAGPKKQWSCPAGPFPAQSMGAATNICNSGGFKYNYGYNEGPTWIASQNAFFFSNFIQGSNMGGDIIKYPLGGTCEVWLHDVGCNGLGVSPSGNLLAACHGSRSVMEYDLTTKVGRRLSTMVDGKQLDSPNDLIARSDGNVYFSNTTYELGDGVKGLDFALVRIDPFGVSSVIEAGNLNGVALSPDETKLYVVGKGVFNLDAAGKATKGQGPVPKGDGIAMDCAGNITNTGTNSAYGGPDGKTLIAVGGGTAAKTYPMTVPGLP